VTAWIQPENTAREGDVQRQSRGVDSAASRFKIHLGDDVAFRETKSFARDRMALAEYMTAR